MNCYKARSHADAAAAGAAAKRAEVLCRRPYCWQVQRREVKHTIGREWLAPDQMLVVATLHLYDFAEEGTC